MGKQTSPFDALTPRERQERWLEFQSTRLPYISGNVDGEPEEPKPQPQPVQEARPKPSVRTEEQASFNRARHHQYDSVIQKMRQAERKLSAYQRVE